MVSLTRLGTLGTSVFNIQREYIFLFIILSEVIDFTILQ